MSACGGAAGKGSEGSRGHQAAGCGLDEWTYRDEVGPACDYRIRDSVGRIGGDTGLGETFGNSMTELLGVEQIVCCDVDQGASTQA